MKKRYIIGILVIAGFLVIAFFSLVKTDIEYADFNKAKEKTGRKVQVKGQWVREKRSDYSSEKNEFRFVMRDENNNELQVIYKGSKPNNFEIASHVVATGKIDNNIFYASDLLTKCPSKYDGQKYNPDAK
jgi:cytochrome c-type biogenesis protein CcmE